MLAGLPYVVWPIGSLFILASRKKDDPFLHYHAVQGGLFGAATVAMCFIGFVILAVAFRLLPGSSTYLPGMMGMGVLLGGGAVGMLIFFTAIFLGWRATEGEMLRLPFAGDYAENRMLDHTGMTRREFLQMLEESFIEPSASEPEAIPFPAYGASVAEVRAAEVLAARSADPTPASQKAAEILAHRQAKQAAERQSQAAAQAALKASQQAASLAAQQAAALQAARQAVPPKAPGQQPSGSPQGQRPPSAAGSSPSQTASARPQPPSPIEPRQQTPTGGQTVVDHRAKSYPLIREASSPSPPAPVASSTGSPARATPPAQKPPSAPNRRPSLGQNPPPQVPSGNSPAPQVKEVDLVRHYKERRTAATQQSDALRNWLSGVDESGT